ncbi:PREDICTED: RNA-binding protein Nova-1-like [Priapulus caudatus]|uniref:RNA-binding protein Nova-1-like n=1 Tax=Priapulus caudatus TaxID=37621 RepID=A0ABM1E5X4_PRICU|nr:PREDICTED: RNA-binding protein Nova-1-like [Priapulus caudatus]
MDMDEDDNILPVHTPVCNPEGQQDVLGIFDMGDVGLTTTHSQPSFDGGNFHLKVLVPAIAAGAIIGKGGETIAQLQRETGARVKMSKANDFYPGSSERVCLISGNAENILHTLDFVMLKILEKPDPTAKAAIDYDHKFAAQREKQVKVLVPNSTAGMIIGKAGANVKHIKEESGAYVQISQKAKDVTLPERCITVIGDLEQNRRACALILDKIVGDSQSSSCTNLSYADFSGPVANCNPTGSPFARSPSAGAPPSGGPTLNSGGGGGGGSALFENMQALLRKCGFSEQATAEITVAMNTLASYGLLSVGLGGLQALAPHAGPATHPALQGLVGLGAGLLQGKPPGGGAGAGGLGYTGAAAAAATAYGPVGSPGSSGQSAGGGMAQADRHHHHQQQQQQQQQQFDAALTEFQENVRMSPSSSPCYASNSFGLRAGSPLEITTDQEDVSTVALEVNENIVGAILGHGGRSLLEIQQRSGATIQISKKGVYAPGTLNRLVTITGSPAALQVAQLMIQQHISQEETRRQHQNTVPVGR